MHTTRLSLALFAALLSLWPALASAGDRAYYVAFFVAEQEGSAWPEGAADAVLAELLRCGEEPVAQCRRTHVVDGEGALDTSGNVLLATLPGVDAATADGAARGRAAERRALATASESTAVDGIVVARIDAQGQVTLDALDPRGRRLARATGRVVDGALPASTVRSMVRRVMVPIARRFAP